MARIGRDERLALLARRQHGAFSYAQALAQGFPSSTISHRLRSGAWERRLPGVLLLAGSTPSRRQDLWVAVLAAGPCSSVTHESAGLVYGAERLPVLPITLTNPHGAHHRLRGIFVHQIDDLVASHRTAHDGLPISRPARTVVELGATQSIDVVGRVADDLVRMRKTTYGEIAAVLAQLVRPGKPGVVRVARMLDERGDGHVPPASELERALFAALAAGGLPAPVRQLTLPGSGSIRGIADAGYPDAQIVIEVDGRRWHDRVAAGRRDRERDAQVARAGWVPLRFVYEHVTATPDELCRTVAEVRSIRLTQLGRAA